MPLEPCFEDALRSTEPVERLRTLAVRLLSEGNDQASVLALFEKARQQLRSEDREPEEDAVMDVMDVLSGWCGPHVKLGSHPEHQQQPF